MTQAPSLVMIDTVRVLDDIFLQIAEAAGGRRELDDAVEAMWLALESGTLRLVVAGKRLRIEPLRGSEAERLLVVERNWPLVAARKRVLCGSYEGDQPSASENEGATNNAASL
jgi:hypothetical protein